MSRSGFRFNPNDVRSELFGMELLQRENKSGQWLIDHGYGSNATVFSIIKKITNGAKNIILNVEDQDGNIIEDGELFDKIQMPGIYQGELINQEDWVEFAMTYLLASGNMYQRIVELPGVKGLPDLEIVPSGIINPIAPRSFFQSNNGFKIMDKERTFDVLSDEINHTKYVNPTRHGINSLIGLSPIQAGLFGLTGSTDIQRALAVMVKNQGVRGIISPDVPLGAIGDASIMKRVLATIKGKILGIDKINSLHTSDTPIKYLAMGMSAADLKLLESGVLTDRLLCNLYGFSSRLLNDPNGTTYNNLIEDTKTLYTGAVLPALTKVVGSFNNITAKEFNRSSTNKQKVVLDTSKVEALQGDKLKTAEKDRKNALGIKDVLSSDTDTTGKVEILMFVYDMPEDQAKIIVGNGTDGKD